MDKKILINGWIWIIFVIMLSFFLGVFSYAYTGEKTKLMESDRIFSQIRSDISSMDYDKALKSLNDYYSSAEYENDDVICFLKGRAYFGKGDYSFAVQMFEKAKEANILLLKSYDYLYYYGLSLYASEESQGYQKIMEAALLVSPREPKNNQLKGILQKNGIE